MSAPQTDVDKQAKQHKPALSGMAAGLIFATIILIGFIVYVVATGDDPDGAEVQVDSRTGEEVTASE